MLTIERNQVVERKAVVTGDEIDALFCFAFCAAIDIRAAGKAEGEGAGGATVAFEKSPDIIAKPAVPFLPTVAGELADLIEAGGVSGFGD